MRRKHALITTAMALAMSAAPLAVAHPQQGEKIDIATSPAHSAPSSNQKLSGR